MGARLGGEAVRCREPGSRISAAKLLASRSRAEPRGGETAPASRLRGRRRTHDTVEAHRPASAPLATRERCARAHARWRRGSMRELRRTRGLEGRGGKRPKGLPRPWPLIAERPSPTSCGDGWPRAVLRDVARKRRDDRQRRAERLHTPLQPTPSPQPNRPTAQDMGEQRAMRSPFSKPGARFAAEHHRTFKSGEREAVPALRLRYTRSVRNAHLLLTHIAARRPGVGAGRGGRGGRGGPGRLAAVARLCPKSGEPPGTPPAARGTRPEPSVRRGAPPRGGRPTRSLCAGSPTLHRPGAPSLRARAIRAAPPTRGGSCVRAPGGPGRIVRPIATAGVVKTAVRGFGRTGRS